MTKPKNKPLCVLANPVPMSEWSKTREAERISYPEGPPDRASWKTQEVYKGTELTYRGQEPRNKVFLAGRPL